MRIELINEAVTVRADFHGGRATPLAFRLGPREHRVTGVNARWVDRSGKDPRFCFSVTTETGDVYQLHMSAADLVWRLESVTLDG